MDKNKDFSEFAVFVKEYLEPINDLELLILKGHNLVEFCINRYIEYIVPRPSEFSKMNLTFSQKIGVMKFLTEIHFNIFELISLLNRVRNNLAHNLHPDMETIDKFLLQASYKYEIVQINANPDKILLLKYAIRNICIELNFGRVGAKSLLGHQIREEMDAFYKMRSMEK